MHRGGGGECPSVIPFSDTLINPPAPGSVERAPKTSRKTKQHFRANRCVNYARAPEKTILFFKIKKEKKKKEEDGERRRGGSRVGKRKKGFEDSGESK